MSVAEGQCKISIEKFEVLIGKELNQNEKSLFIWAYCEGAEIALERAIIILKE